MFVSKKKINPSGIDVDNNLAAAGVGPGPDAPKGSKTASYIGRLISHHSTSSTNVIPTIVQPHNFVGRHESPPLYSAKALSPSTTTNPSVLEMGEVNPITALTEENVRRRTFFFQLRDTLAREIFIVPVLGSSTTTVKFNNDNYEATTGGIPNCCTLTCCMNRTSFNSDSIPRDINYFAHRIALAVVYIYQDHIPILTSKSNGTLINRFADIVIKYCFPRHHIIDQGEGVVYERRPSDFIYSDVYTIVMSSLNLREEEGLYFRIDQNCCFEVNLGIMPTRLRTNEGFEFSFNQLFSTGICTHDGTKLEPTHPDCQRHFNELKNRRNFPLYRWGTIDAYNLKNRSYMYQIQSDRNNYKDISEMPKNDLKIIREERNKDDFQIPTNHIDFSEKAIFWQKVEDLASLFLTKQEFQTP